MSVYRSPDPATDGGDSSLTCGPTPPTSGNSGTPAACSLDDNQSIGPAPTEDDSTQSCSAPTPPAAGNGGTPAACTTCPCPLQAKKILTIVWAEKDAWCSEIVHLQGTTVNYADGEQLALQVQDKNDGKTVNSFVEAISGNQFSHLWQILDYLPKQNGPHYVEQIQLNGTTSDKKTPTPLVVHFIPNLPKTPYAADNAHFDLNAQDYVVNITSEIKYVQGWGAEVVNLAGYVPVQTAGLLDGKLKWPGYRWMKRDSGKRKYWDGSSWQDIPKGLNLDDPINDHLAFAVGFYKVGSKYTCQYGGDWVETFTDWDINATDKQTKIRNWEKNANTVWTGNFDIKRKECKSSNAKCCRYTTKAKVTLTNSKTYVKGDLVIADGNIRSNDSLWFLGETRITVAAHEFGHHLGNPDEYTGAAVDVTLNDDGAVKGIDADSIMGQNLTKVKARHYRTICKHMASIVSNQTGKSYTYIPVPK